MVVVEVGIVAMMVDSVAFDKGNDIVRDNVLTKEWVALIDDGCSIEMVLYNCELIDWVEGGVFNEGRISKKFG